MEDLVEDARQQLDKLRDSLLTRSSGKLSVTTIVKQGDIVGELRECCFENNTYAVVMGRDEMGSFERFLIGSRTVTGIRQLPCPVIAVPPGASFKGIRNIGIACDFRDVIETLPVPEIKQMVRELKATLHVLHVSDVAGDALDARTIEESGWFQDLVGDLKPRYHFIKASAADQAIIDFADKESLDLLIIIPKQHGLISKILKHSHSSQLVLHAHVPVMAIH
jgi:nucleotide-binding universal stress UspA family protein